MTARPIVESFRAYDLKQYTLIPLHKPFATKTMERKGDTITIKVGKRPLHAKWSTEKVDSRKTIDDAEKAGRNVGVRLTETQLVIDVDPRNGGNESFEELCLDIGLNPTDYPCVTTGSGGLHLYMTIPAGVLVVDTIEGYPGVEFKSKGRQVLAAGCLHPETGNPYVFTDGHPDINERVPAPKGLLRVITREARPSQAGGGTVTPDKLAAALEALDPTDFRDHDSWMRLMMAAHHATGGDGRSEFIEWSTSDPHYADESENIGRRWDSMHAEKDGGVTGATINMHLKEKGAPREAFLNLRPARDDFDDEDFLPDTDDAEDFEDGAAADNAAPKPKAKKAKPAEDDYSEFEDGADPDSDGSLDCGYSEHALSELEKLNKKFCLVMEGGKTNVLYEMPDVQVGRKVWHRLQTQHFSTFFGNQKIERDMTGLSRNASPTIQLGKAWLEWPDRESFDGIFFDPSEEKIAVRAMEAEGFKMKNLWTGWGLQSSKAGSWKYMEELLFEAVCGGNQVYFEYLINWCRYMFQHPNTQGHVAIVTKGEKGVGKSTLGAALCKIVGRHSLHLSSSASLTGKFNAHMQDTIFLFSDEAVRPNDMAAESELKHIITSDTLNIERKGHDRIEARNYLHIQLASNHDWVVPASVDERRFFVVNVLNKYQRDPDFFKKLRAELGYPDSGGDGQYLGLSRMLFDFLRTDLPVGWHPARNLPETEALQEQKRRSHDPMGQWLLNQLLDATWDFPVMEAREPGRVRVFNQHFQDAFSAFCHHRGINPGAMGRGSVQFLYEQLGRFLPSLKTRQRNEPDPELYPEIKVAPTDGRAWSFEIPDINHARTEYEKSARDPVNWPIVPGTDEGNDAEFG
jgi:hypothetical protein